MTIHVVQAGETIYSIAAEQGLADWRVVYDHPNNAGLRELRPNPGVLFAGDEVFIPDRPPAASSASTGADHWFVAKRPGHFVELILEDTRGDALAWRACSLTVEGVKLPGHTGNHGRVRFALPLTAKEGDLEVAGAEPGAEPTRYGLKVGELDPVEKVRGQQARLNNLGFICGAHDDTMNSSTQRALAAFQLNHGLEGEDPGGPATLECLERVHRGERG
ncbi:MAG: hypothetical protein R3B40_29355 [Polyangiales bacterium]